ncbi:MULTISPECIES: septation protein SepH [Mycolicibacter]|uniref:Septation protein SepH n=1 Tax=[Mycobacterium] vasticus TaxID=2875777 RepID=A0ABU5YZ83_9MYCO|nr:MULTISPECIES: septation protein SepH [unclassified Mycolicibacter]MEB3064407.1 septation protein SepH [Mycolicibacter sp. MYC101]MEB3070205.1 septation protein SepH [Mycolicibacter sp. MYC017]
MRELTVIGLDVDGKHIICESVGGEDERTDMFRLRIEDQLRGALRDEGRRAGQTTPGGKMLRPKDIQSRIRAGASVEQVAAAAGVEVSRVERFAHPVLLERSRAAELATAAHPVLADGPAVPTLLEVITGALMARGLSTEHTSWDAWRNEDGRWTVQLAWKAGRSDNVAHFRFTPGAHGGTVTAADDAAMELIDPAFDRPLRPVAPVAELDFEEPAAPAAPESEPVRRRAAPRARRSKPEVPGWEDVLLGVRSTGTGTAGQG